MQLQNKRYMLHMKGLEIMLGEPSHPLCGVLRTHPSEMAEAVDIGFPDCSTHVLRTVYRDQCSYVS